MVVLTIDLALLVLLAMANHTASKTLLQQTIAMHARRASMVIISVHILSAIAAIIWTGMESSIGLGPLLVSKSMRPSLSTILITYSLSLLRHPFSTASHL
jgi:hypothetical protein